jgi:hypothetical protein
MEYTSAQTLGYVTMNATLKEILRNLKRHRGTAPWYEPAREPATGEVRGFKWQAPSGRTLMFLLDASGRILVTRGESGVTASEAEPIVLASNELEVMRDHYQWLAGKTSAA